MLRFRMVSQRLRKSFDSPPSMLIIFSLCRSRRPVPSLTNPMGNSNSMNSNSSHTFMHGNGNHHSHGPSKKNSSLSNQNNPFSYLPPSTNQNKYSNMPAPMGSSMSNPHHRAPMMNNFIPTSNGQSPPPPPHILNGNEMDQNFPPINVRLFELFSIRSSKCCLSSSPTMSTI